MPDHIVTLLCNSVKTVFYFGTWNNILVKKAFHVVNFYFRLRIWRRLLLTGEVESCLSATLPARPSDALQPQKLLRLGLSKPSAENFNLILKSDESFRISNCPLFWESIFGVSHLREIKIPKWEIYKKSHKLIKIEVRREYFWPLNAYRYG